MTSALAFLAVMAFATTTTPVFAATPTDNHAASISFAAPRDFATRAVPPSAAFNRAAGDQLAFQISRTTLSDSVASGSFNGDNARDVVQTNVLAGSLSIFLGDGNGGFSRPKVIPVGLHPSFVVADHLDGDDRLDLAVADAGASSVVILRGDGDGGFAISEVVPVPPSPRSLAVGDVNGDAVADLAVASRAGLAPVGGVTILLGNIDPLGELRFAPSQVISLRKADQPVGANTVVLADFDRSGRDDVAVGVGTSQSAGDRPAGSTERTGDDLLVYLNQNASDRDAFAASPSQRFRVGASPDAIAVGRWDRDVHSDLAVLNSQSGDVTTLSNDGHGRFGVTSVNTTVGALPRSLKVADFDRDGVADLATATFAMSTVSVLQGRGDGTFESAADFWVGDAPSGVEVGDFGGDRRPDIVAARLRDDHLALLVNQSPGRGDGVKVFRDIAYVHDPANPYASHQVLDLYAPPPATKSFAGGGRAYPVVLFAHGGAHLTGDKTMVAFLMRSLARRGVVAVSMDYRLTSASDVDAQAGDYANAFRWLRANVAKFSGDPAKIVITGTSAGAAVAMRFATSKTFAADQPHIRGMLHVGPAPSSLLSDPPTADVLPPTLVIVGSDGLENAGAVAATGFRVLGAARGESVNVVRVPNRDHITVVSNLARDNDRGSVAFVKFLRRVVG